VPFGVFAVAALAQIVLAAVPLRARLVTAVVLMVVGLGSLAVAALAGVLWLFVAGGLVAGAGVGLLFRASLDVAGGLAAPDARGEVLAAMFLLAYVGLTVPVLAVGLALAVAPAVPVLVAFSAAVAAVVVFSGVRMLARRAR
jgi:hypothetical protein